MSDFIKLFLLYLIVGICIAMGFGYQPYTYPFGWCIFIAECIAMMHFIFIQLLKYLENSNHGRRF